MRILEENNCEEQLDVALIEHQKVTGNTYYHSLLKSKHSKLQKTINPAIVVVHL